MPVGLWIVMSLAARCVDLTKVPKVVWLAEWGPHMTVTLDPAVHCNNGAVKQRLAATHSGHSWSKASVDAMGIFISGNGLFDWGSDFFSMSTDLLPI